MEGQIMPRVQLPAVTPKRRASNKGRLGGQKRPLLPKQVWAIRARLELAGNLRDLASFNVAIDSKLRGCDLVSRQVIDLLRDDRMHERVSVVQSKTNKPVQFELAENTRETVTNWIKSPEMIVCQLLLPSRFHDRPHISTRQYGRLVRDLGCLDWFGTKWLRHPFYAPNEGGGNLSQDRQPACCSASAWPHKN